MDPARGPGGAGHVGVGRGHDDDPAVLGGDQHVAVADAVHDRTFQRADRRLGVREPAGGRGQRHLMRPGHVQAEGLGPFHQPAHVGVAAQQVLDELPPQRLLPAHHLPAGLGVALGQAGDRGVDHVQHGVGGGPHGAAVPRADHHRELSPQPTGRAEVELDGAARRHAELGGPSAEQAHRVELGGVGLAPGGGGVGQHRQVVAEQLHRNPAGLPAGGLRDLGQPRVIGCDGSAGVQGRRSPRSVTPPLRSPAAGSARRCHAHCHATSVSTRAVATPTIDGFSGCSSVRGSCRGPTPVHVRELAGDCACHGAVVADDRDRAVAVAQDGVADRAEHRSQDVSSAAGPDHEQGGPAGLGDQRVRGVAAHECGVDRDVGELGLPAVQGALEGAARERFGQRR